MSARGCIVRGDIWREPAYLRGLNQDWDQTLFCGILDVITTLGGSHVLSHASLRLVPPITENSLYTRGLEHTSCRNEHMV